MIDDVLYINFMYVKAIYYKPNDWCYKSGID